MHDRLHVIHGISQDMSWVYIFELRCCVYLTQPVYWSRVKVKTNFIEKYSNELLSIVIFSFTLGIVFRL